MVHRPVVAGVAVGNRVIIKPLGRCLRVCARAPAVVRTPIQKHCVRRLGFRVCATSEGSEEVVESSSGLIKDLNAELNLLDEAVAEWQQRLALSQEQQEGDMRTIAELSESVKAEQQAWQQEMDEMEELMKLNANVELSNQEVRMMQERSAVLKRKVQLFKGLLKERDREVQSLRTQLEDLCQMGELKKIKEQRAVTQDAVVAGAAVSSELGAGAIYPVERSSSVPPNPSLWGDTQVSDTSLTGPIPDVDSLVPPRSSIDSVKPFTDRSTSTIKLETPGLLLLSTAMIASELGANIWQAIEQLIPEKYHMLVRIIGVSAISMLFASTLSPSF